ncbi:carotenoid biosynthesis protein [Paenibacillus sp. CAU 1782]
MGKLFVFWYVVGLLLMLTVGVPDWLAFSNGLFLVFFACCALDVERLLGEKVVIRWGRAFAAGLLTFSVEWLGVATGWPFGTYHYSSVLGFSLGGVPLTIAFAWAGVIVTAVLLSDSGSKWLRAFWVGLCTVIFDLVLDPVAYARSFWSWEGDGGYYGIPFSNFASWFLISFALSFLFPIRAVPVPVRRKAVTLSQMMLMMFGLLGIREEQYLPILIAVAASALLEGGLRYKIAKRTPPF